MQLYHNSSSLYIDDKIDVIYGKYFPAKIYNNELDPIACNYKNCPTSKVTIYCEVYGLFGNLTKRFAERMDEYAVKCEGNCYIKENLLLEKFPMDTLISIAEEPGFWYGVPKYQWFWPMLEEFYKCSNGNRFLLSDWEYAEQLSDRYMWIKKSFGTSLADNLIWTCDKNRPLLATSRRHLLIDCDLSNIEAWINAGGSGFW